MNTEQLAFNLDGRTFSGYDFSRAHSLLAALRDPFDMWPQGVEQPPQHVWDTRTHTYKDRKILDRDALRRIERGRLPFELTAPYDEMTGEAMTDTERNRVLIADGFSEHTITGKKRVARGTSAKRRRIHAPGDAFKRFHADFLGWAWGAYTLHTSAFGLQGDKSFLDNAIVHAGNRYFLTMDISSAYDNVEHRRLATELCGTEMTKLGPLGWYPIVKKFFAPEGARRGIATGGNASPLLFNIYMRRFDETVSAYALAFGLTYTRYMDDITLSSPDTGNQNRDRIGKRMAKFVKDAMRAIEFEPNQHKVRYKDVAEQGPVMLPGTELSADGVWRIPSRAVSNMLAELHRISEIATNAPNALTENDKGRVHGINSYTEHFIGRRALHGLAPDEREQVLRGEYYRVRSQLPEIERRRPGIRVYDDTVVANLLEDQRQHMEYMNDTVRWLNITNSADLDLLKGDTQQAAAQDG